MGVSGCALNSPRSSILIVEKQIVIVRDTIMYGEYFTDGELNCNCGCGTKPTRKAYDALTQLRLAYKKPILVNSGARCEEHNKKVGGVHNSRHFVNRDAFDVQISGGKDDYALFQHYAIEAGFNGFGYLNIKNGTLHIDMRENRKIWTY